MPAQIKYSLYQLLWQRVLLICCGYEDVIDGALLAHDPGLGLALLAGEDGESMGPASQPTVCRFENDMSAANCYRLAMWLVFAYIARKKQRPKSIRLDFDGSCIPAHGQQQGSSFRSYYDTNMQTMFKLGTLLRSCWAARKGWSSDISMGWVTQTPTA